MKGWKPGREKFGQELVFKAWQTLVRSQCKPLKRVSLAAGQLRDWPKQPHPTVQWSTLRVHARREVTGWGYRRQALHSARNQAIGAARYPDRAKFSASCVGASRHLWLRPRATHLADFGRGKGSNTPRPCTVTGLRLITDSCGDKSMSICKVTHILNSYYFLVIKPLPIVYNSQAESHFIVNFFVSD